MGSAARTLTLACMALGAGAVAAQGPDAAEVTRARERGEAWLAKLVAAQHNARLALVCLALVDAPASEARTRALARLAQSRIGDTYGLGLRLMVAAAAGSDLPGAHAVATRDLAALLRHQTVEGGFGYRPAKGDGRWDLSNTQYAALGLHAAVELGLEVPHAAWQGLAKALYPNQWVDGGFGYRPDDEPTLSMTVAGVTVLDLCVRHMSKRTRGRPALSNAAQRGWAWLARQGDAIGAPGQPWLHYAHYGLARAALLSERERIGNPRAGIDWYARGAALLLSLERPGDGGGWPDAVLPLAVPAEGAELPPAEPVATAFAVLFLRKALPGKARPGPVTGPRGVYVRGLRAEASNAEVDATVALEVSRGLDAVPDLLRALRSDVVARRRAAALALMKISGEDFSYVPYRHPATQDAAIKAAERWYLTRR